MKRNSGRIGTKSSVTLSNATGVFDTFDAYNFKRGNSWPVVPKVSSAALSTTSINEGQTLTITVTTTDISNGTTLYWTTNTVSGTITAGDFQDQTLTGSFTISSNSGTISRAIRNDGTNPATFEGTESFTISIRKDSTSGEILATTATVSINDTSTLVTTVAINTFFNGLTGYLPAYMSEFRNASFYSYTLDGTAQYISDGGGDMYDIGNYTALYTNTGTLTANLNYNDPLTTLDTDLVYRGLGYGTSPDYRPLSMMAYRDTSTQKYLGWQKTGNMGADGGGLQISGWVHQGATVNTFVVHAWYRQTYNAGDPSACDLFIFLGHSQWASSFGTFTVFAPASTDSNNDYAYTTNSTNIITIVTLLSKSGGVAVTVAEMQTVIAAWISRIKTYLGY